ncbi:MAG: asparagine synthase C-terminal domain-containing protein [Alphaproteobacteria bacterium]
MSVAVETRSTPVDVPVDLDDIAGWARTDAPEGRLWFKGYLHGMDPQGLIRKLTDAGAGDIPGVLRSLDGHFAFVWSGGGRTVAATDPVGSIPLFFRLDGAEVAITGLASRLGRAGDAIDPDAALQFAMGGFTIGHRTLNGAVTPLGCARYLVAAPGVAPTVGRYQTYLPEPAADDADPDGSALADLMLRVMEKMVRGIAGRPIVAPLSAGLDSRLIVSALKELAYDNVICVSYGRAGNFEAAGAKRIAAHLGYPWHFIEHTNRQQAETFAGDECRRFVNRLADSQCAVPFQQDFHAVSTARATGIAPPEAVYVNGQSGDYITGNHIPGVLGQPGADRADMYRAIIAKHFSLWDCLKTPDNIARIENAVAADLAEMAGDRVNSAAPFALFEASEFENRQSKYVVSGQRTYEWFGFDWRLPLWDRDLVDYWRTAPLAAKLGQKRYRDVLMRENWGGVWTPDFSVRKAIVPAWIRPIRFAAKAAHVLKGRDAWHRFEKNRIAWLTDPVANYAVAPYRTVANDTRGHRNAISWHVEAYLNGKGIGLHDDGHVSVQ